MNSEPDSDTRRGRYPASSGHSTLELSGGVAVPLNGWFALRCVGLDSQLCRNLLY